jgi:hypothetical protein
MQTEPTARVSVFASYAPQDPTLQHELEEHLRPMHREGLMKPRQESLDRYLSHLLDQNLVTFSNFFPLTNDRKVYGTT